MSLNFKLDEIKLILKQSSELSAIPVTTAKDYVRLPTEVQPMIKTIEIALGDNIKDYDQNLIPLRWWYPENYRMSNYDDFIDKISNFENIQNMMKHAEDGKIDA